MTPSGPEGVAIDPAAGRIYWANSAGNRISVAKLNGSGGHNLNTSGATVNAPRGIAIDPAAGRIYWANSGANTISFALLDGSGGGNLNTLGLTVNDPEGIAIDRANRRLYWTNRGMDTISYLNLKGGGGGDVTTTPATVDEPIGVAIDPAAGEILWASAKGDTISLANLNGAGGVDLATGSATVNAPTFPALLRSPSGTGRPKITGGSALGSKLSCSKGSCARDLLGSFVYRAPQSFAFKWSRNGTNIAGGAKRSIKARSPGTYRCRVTATNHAGSASQTSAGHTVRAT